MSDLASLVRAAIEETERIAREALDFEQWDAQPGVWRFDFQGRPVPRIVGAEWQSSTTDGIWNCEDQLDDCHEYRARGTAEGKHIAHHDPATVLRRCAADRRIVEQYQSLDEAPADVDRGVLSIVRRELGLVLLAMAEGYGIEEYGT